MGFYGEIMIINVTEQMKPNYIKAFIVMMLMALTVPSIANDKPGITSAMPVEGNRAIVLQNRLEEIKLTDRNKLSTAEKKKLRKEVKEIKKELAAISGGVYLSIGAIILIALLLILLL